MFVNDFKAQWADEVDDDFAGDRNVGEAGGMVMVVEVGLEKPDGVVVDCHGMVASVSRTQGSSLHMNSDMRPLISIHASVLSKSSTGIP